MTFEDYIGKKLIGSAGDAYIIGERGGRALSLFRCNLFVGCQNS